MKTTAAIIGLTAFLAGGCNTVVVDDPSPLPPVVGVPGPYPAPGLPPRGCSADDADDALGQRASASIVEQATFDSGANSARVIEPGAAYTEDFRPDRLNIFLDARGRIVDLTCG